LSLFKTTTERIIVEKKEKRKQGEKDLRGTGGLGGKQH